jgi:hypothetical protein
MLQNTMKFLTIFELESQIQCLCLTIQLLCRHHDLVNRYGVSVSQVTTDMFRLS